MNALLSALATPCFDPAPASTSDERSLLRQPACPRRMQMRLDSVRWGSRFLLVERLRRRARLPYGGYEHGEVLEGLIDTVVSPPELELGRLADRLRSTIAPSSLFCPSLPLVAHGSRPYPQWFSYNPHEVKLGAVRPDAISPVHIRGRVTVAVPATSVEACSLASAVCAAASATPHPFRVWVLATAELLAAFERTVIDDNVHGRVLHSFEPLPVDRGRTSIDVACLVLQNRSAVKYWSAQCSNSPDVATQSARPNGCPWSRAFHWYDPFFPPDEHGWFFGAGKRCDKTLRNALQRMEEHDRYAGMLGILPRGLMDVLHRLPNAVGGAGDAASRRSCLSLEKRVRELLVRGSHNIFKSWAMSSRAFFSSLWAR